jgi:hypothetical protein
MKGKSPVVKVKTLVLQRGDDLTSSNPDELVGRCLGMQFVKLFQPLQQLGQPSLNLVGSA